MLSLSLSHTHTHTHTHSLTHSLTLSLPPSLPPSLSLSPPLSLTLFLHTRSDEALARDGPLGALLHAVSDKTDDPVDYSDLD